MPTYEYLCQGSQHRFEVFQRMSDDPLKECPSCGSEVRRVIYPAGVIFKGSGFYVTDSRKAANGNGSSGDGEAKASTEKSPEKTGDSSTASSAPEKKESGGAKEATASAA